jgi:hypothetical protein
MKNHPVHFYDSASPHNIPSGVHAAVCINGAYAWRESDIQRMEAVFRYIAVEHDGKNNIAEWAQHARGVDIEPGCVWPPERAMPFLEARARENGDATAYCDRSTFPVVARLVMQARISVHYWVATLDGTMSVHGAWAVQYRDVNNLYDLSVLLGENNFVKP